MSQQSTIFPLKVSDLTVRKRGKTILSKINLTLNQSGFTVVMGPNGSGKTTLLRVMHGPGASAPGIGRVVGVHRRCTFASGHSSFRLR